MLFRFCLYGFLKNQRYFEPFLVLAFLDLGLSFFWIGVLAAVRSATINLLEIPSGALADTWGRRGTLMVSFVAYIFCFLCLAFATQFHWLVLAMSLYGVGDSFRTGTHKAMIFEWLRIHGRESEKTKIYGITRSWSKFGSALSSLLAALFVILSGQYRTVFLLAAIPCVFNVINFLGYPKELEGSELPSRRTVGTTVRSLADTFRQMIRNANLRRLVFESMSWEGVFHAVKDYLQPALAMWVVLAVTGQSNGDPTSVPIAIGITYTVLFLLSGMASRQSHRLVQWCGGERQASDRLWIVNALLFGTLTFGALTGVSIIVVVVFVGLNVAQNIWRPVLISRFDGHSEPGRGATVLSIESGAQRLATFFIAPLLGLAVDYVSADATLVSLWPVGIVGLVGAALMIVIPHPSTVDQHPHKTAGGTGT
ncbi:MAG: MFS transporter [Planctomycetota bacterium]